MIRPGKKVLILSVSAGTGHIRAAEALEKVFRQQPDVAEVVSVDALQFTNKIFRDFYSKLYIQLVQSAPTFLGWWYKTSDEPWKTDKMRLMMDRLNLGPLTKFIQAYNPDITVCTHFLPAEIISHLIYAQKLQAQLSIVVTDFDFHAMWLSRVFHRYFVALDETKAHLACLGLPTERITVSGIPIDPLFRPVEDPAPLRGACGLDPDLPMLLVSAGALGVSPTEAVLEGLTRLHTPAQAVVICGKNEELKTTLEAKLQANPPKRLRVHLLGYTTEMHQWMGAASLFIGKPGGLTTSEALAIGLPMAIVAPIPGQEERNSDHLLEKGIAIKCNEFTTLPYKIEELLLNPSRLATMRRQAHHFGHPDSAKIIVQTLLRDDRLAHAPIEVDPEQQQEMLKATGKITKTKTVSLERFFKFRKPKVQWKLE
jgi:processive 1,2-diacylglycerol beta-glucosyltransferase